MELEVSLMCPDGDCQERFLVCHCMSESGISRAGHRNLEVPALTYSYSCELFSSCNISIVYGQHTPHSTAPTANILCCILKIC